MLTNLPSKSDAPNWDSVSSYRVLLFALALLAHSLAPVLLARVDSVDRLVNRRLNRLSVDRLAFTPLVTPGTSGTGARGDTAPKRRCIAAGLRLFSAVRLLMIVQFKPSALSSETI